LVGPTDPLPAAGTDGPTDREGGGLDLPLQVRDLLRLLLGAPCNTPGERI